MRLHHDHRPEPSVAGAHQHLSCQEVVELITEHLERATRDGGRRKHGPGMMRVERKHDD
jgi:hypothetical protein